MLRQNFAGKSSFPIEAFASPLSANHPTAKIGGVHGQIDNIMPTISAVGFDNPAPTIACDGIAVATRSASGTKLVSHDFPVFHLVA